MIRNDEYYIYFITNSRHANCFNLAWDKETPAFNSSLEIGIPTVSLIQILGMVLYIFKFCF